METSFRAADLVGADRGGGIAALIRAAELPQAEYQPRLADVEDGILVWTLPSFSIDADSLEAARRRLRGRAGLVLDLRGNGGGSRETLRKVLGMLYPGRVEIGTRVERARHRPLVAEGTGANAFAGPVIVLVDSRSSSAAEVLARTIQLTRRGVVLGDRTAGAVMSAFQLQMRIGAEQPLIYGLSVTDADVVMADGGRLENVGVTPDERILPTPAQMAAGEDPVMARAMELLRGGSTSSESPPPDVRESAMR